MEEVVWTEKMKDGDILQANLSLVGIQKWLNEKYKVKRSGVPFNIQDVEGYVARENIPEYLGGHRIVLVNNKYSKVYNLIYKK